MANANTPGGARIMVNLHEAERNFANVGNTFRVLMTSLEATVQATTTERSARLELSKLNCCLCQSNLCMICKVPIVDRLVKVMNYVVRLGRHNDMLKSQTDRDGFRRISLLMEAIEWVCRDHFRRLASADPTKQGRECMMAAISKLLDNFAESNGVIEFDVCHSALIRIASYAFHSVFIQHISGGTIIDMINSIRRCIEAVPMNDEWFATFRAGRLDVLIQEVTVLLGEMFVTVPKQEAQTNQYGQLVRVVLDLVFSIINLVFSHFPTIGTITLISVDTNIYAIAARTLTDSAVALLKLLRIYQDLYSNSNDQYSFPCENVPAFRQQLTREMNDWKKHDHFKLEQIWSAFDQRIDKVFPALGKPTDRGEDENRLLNAVQHQLRVGAPIVRRAIHLVYMVPNKGGDIQLENQAISYFTTGKFP